MNLRRALLLPVLALPLLAASPSIFAAAVPMDPAASAQAAAPKKSVGM